MRKEFRDTGQLVAEPIIILGNCALPIEYQSVWKPQFVQNRLKKFGEFMGFKMPAEPGYRRFGKYKVMAFLPYDRTGNRRFAPVKTNPEEAEALIYENETASRDYIKQMWAEAMEIYRKGDYSLTFSDDMEDYVKKLQTDFMPEDTQVGIIQQFLDDYEDDYICTTIIHQKVFHEYGTLPRWRSKELGEILDNDIVGWSKHGNHRFGDKIGTQRSWKRDNPKTDKDGFMKVNEQMTIPFD